MAFRSRLRHKGKIFFAWSCYRLTKGLRKMESEFYLGGRVVLYRDPFKDT